MVEDVAVEVEGNVDAEEFAGTWGTVSFDERDEELPLVNLPPFAGSISSTEVTSFTALAAAPTCSFLV